MGLLSLLPDEYAWIERWLIKLFLLLGLVMIGPWVFLLVYDLLLYILRSITYEIPIVGGRARGQARPRAPSLTERPRGSGHRRKFSLATRREPPSPSSSAFQSSSSTDARSRNTQGEADGHATKSMSNDD